MNFFCRIFGCTWVTETRAPEVRWNTTKAATVLECSGTTSTSEEEDLETRVEYVERCVRCDETRPSATKRGSGSGSTASGSTA